MASQTIIDQLVVTLGLDPKQFTKGQKEAAQGLVDLKNKASDAGKATDGAGQSFTQAAAKLGLLALVLKGVYRSADAILDASRATRQLGFDARNYDIAADKLRNYENVAKTFGGTAEGVLKTVAGLQRGVFNLTFNGQISDQLVQLGRLGVQFQDKGGHARDFKDIYLDTSEAVSKKVSSGEWTEGEGMAFLQSAGIVDEGLARAALGGRKGAQLAYDQQTYGEQITPGKIASANSIEEEKTRRDILRQQTAVAGMEKADSAIETFYGLQSSLFDELLGGFPSLKGNMLDFFGGVSSLFSKEGFKSLLGIGGGTQSDRTNNPGNLQDGNGNFRSFGTPAEGMIAARRQLGLYRSRGNNTLTGMIGKWNPPGAPGNSQANFEAYVAAVSKETGIDPNAPTTEGDDAAMLAAMFNHEGSSRKYDAAGVADSLSLQEAGARGGGGGTSVQIDEINVHTAATDAQGIANGIGGAVKRKLSAAHAEQGMQ